MNLKIHNVNGKRVAELSSNDILINDVQDSLDLMANAGEFDASKIVVYEHNLTPDFFVLSTCIAGDILQKFSTYNVQLAIIGDFSKFSSKSLKDFIYESNKMGRIFFVPSLNDAIDRLSKN